MYKQKLITDYYFTSLSKWTILNNIEKKFKFIINNSRNSFENFTNKITLKQSLVTDYYSTILHFKPVAIQKTIKDYYRAEM